MDKRCNFYHECKPEYVDIGQRRGRVETRAVAFSFTEQRRESTTSRGLFLDVSLVFIHSSQLLTVISVQDVLHSWWSFLHVRRLFYHPFNHRSSDHLQRFQACRNEDEFVTARIFRGLLVHEWNLFTGREEF